MLVLLLGLGTTAGIVAMALVLRPRARATPAPGCHWVWEWRHPAVRKLARLSGWTIGYVATNQVAFLVVLFLAYGARRRTRRSTSPRSRSSSSRTGCSRSSIMTALAPELAARHQAHDFDGLRDQFAHRAAHARAHVIPAGVGMALLARPI